MPVYTLKKVGSLSRVVLPHLSVISGTGKGEPECGGYLVTVADVFIKATLEYLEGKDLDTYGWVMKVNSTPSCNHQLLSWELLDYISISGEDSVGCREKEMT